LKHFQGFEIQGQLTTGDLARFQYFHIFRRSWPVLALAAAILILWVAILTYDMASAPKLYGILADTLPLIVLLLLWTLLVAIRPYIAAVRQLKMQSYLQDPLTYRFSDEVLAVKGPNASWTVAWNSVRSMIETENLFIIYSDRMAATIVPKRFFENGKAEDDVRVLLSEVARTTFGEAGILGRFC
jgi:hypothetical protein